MNEFKKYRRSQIAELRPVTENEIKSFQDGNERSYLLNNVSISAEDLKAGSPKLGDMIARNPKNHMDKWLVSEQYFKDNFEEII